MEISETNNELNDALNFRIWRGQQVDTKRSFDTMQTAVEVQEGLFNTVDMATALLKPKEVHVGECGGGGVVVLMARRTRHLVYFPHVCV